MIGQIIQSYLVSLGVLIDKPGFQQADMAIKQTGATVEQTAAKMNTSVATVARNFVKASTIISSAIASVTASAVGLMKATAQEDLAMQKFARNMMMTEDAAWRMKKATDALGESINDIALTPELMGRYRQLITDGSKMQIGGDFKQTMQNFRDLIFEFTRLKQEASYAMNWVGYYLMKYLQKPLADIKQKFKDFNDMFVKNMSVWTEKAAKAIYYVIQVGQHFVEFLGQIGKSVKKLWDEFPDGVQKAIAAIGLLTAALNASPMVRAMAGIGMLLLMIDDYFSYMEGKEALWGKYWDQLNIYIEKAKTWYQQLKATVAPYWQMTLEYAGKAKEWFDKLVESAAELKAQFDAWMDSTGTELLNDVVTECKDLWSILNDVYDAVKKTAEDAWKGLWRELDKNDTIKDINKNFKQMWRIFRMIYNTGKDVIRFIIRLYRQLEDSEAVRDFFAAIMELADAVGELFGAIMSVVETALRSLFGEVAKTDKIRAFKDVLQAVVRVLAALVRGFTDVVRWIGKLFNSVANSKTFIRFWEKVGDAIDSVIKKCGKLGRALGALMDGNPKKAWEILKTLGDKEGKEAGAGTTDWNKRTVYERLKAAGYNDEAIAGIMGRVQQEHNFDTSDVPEHWETLENGEKVWVGGLGMFQWNGSRKADFKKWAEESGLDYNDPGVQTDYAIIEAEKRGLTPEEMNKLSIAEAAKRWTDDWEVGRPGDEVKYATQIYSDIKHGNGNTWMNAMPAEGGSSLAGDAVAENAMSYKEGLQWMGGATKDMTIQCDSFTATVYNESGIPSIGGHSTDNTQGHVINDLAFKDAGAWHEGDNYKPRNGDLVGWNWSETSGHYGIYDADSDTVITRDSKGGITHRTLQEAKDTWGDPTGYGSIAEAEQHRKGAIQQTAYTTQNPGISPLGLSPKDMPTQQELDEMVRAGILTPKTASQEATTKPVEAKEQDNGITVYLKQICTLLADIRKDLSGTTRTANTGNRQASERTDKKPAVRQAAAMVREATESEPARQMVAAVTGLQQAGAAVQGAIRNAADPSWRRPFHAVGGGFGGAMTREREQEIQNPLEKLKPVFDEVNKIGWNIGKIFGGHRKKKEAQAGEVAAQDVTQQTAEQTPEQQAKQKKLQNPLEQMKPVFDQVNKIAWDIGKVFGGHRKKKTEGAQQDAPQQEGTKQDTPAGEEQQGAQEPQQEKKKKHRGHGPKFFDVLGGVGSLIGAFSGGKTGQIAGAVGGLINAASHSKEMQGFGKMGGDFAQRYAKFQGMVDNAHKMMEPMASGQAPSYATNTTNNSSTTTTNSNNRTDFNFGNINVGGAGQGGLPPVKIAQDVVDEVQRLAQKVLGNFAGQGSYGAQ